jgi:SPP1 family predicted phage head-tail adaptor
MQSGRLRHQITLQSPSRTRNAVGEPVTTWTDVATVWASVGPLSARDLFAAQQWQAEVTHRVRIRYAPDVADVQDSWRVLFGSRVLVIRTVRNIDERNVEIELLCSEGLRTE